MEIALVNDRTIQVKVNNALYSAEIVHKCFYWFGNKYSVDINLDTDGIFTINIVPKDSIITQALFEEIVTRVKSDLIDFKTREIISLETKNIREVLIAKAFAHHDEFDGIPPGEVNDPVGFSPTIL